jgi:hypothetical protein
MICKNCNGIGRAREGRHMVACNDCKATGKVVYMLRHSLEYDGQVYVVGGTIGYTNTRGRKCLCRIDGFEVTMGFFKYQDAYPQHYYPLKTVLFTGVDTVTGAKVCRPLWRSIPLKKKHELFETCIVEKR